MWNQEILRVLKLYLIFSSYIFLLVFIISNQAINS